LKKITVPRAPVSAVRAPKLTSAAAVKP
jgi:hypothetical protein